MLVSPRSARLAAVLAAACFAGLTSTAVAAGPVDQQNAGPGNQATEFDSAGESFVAGRTGALDAIDVSLRPRADSNYYLRLNVYAAAPDGAPTGDSLGASSLTVFDTSSEDFTANFGFASPVQVTKGQRYVFVMDARSTPTRTPEHTTLQINYDDSADAYADGVGFYNGQPFPNGDAIFATHVTPTMAQALLVGKGVSKIGTPFDFQVTSAGGHVRLDVSASKKYGLREGDVTCFNQVGQAAVFGIADTAGRGTVYREFYVKDGAPTGTPDRLTGIGTAHDTPPPAGCRAVVPTKTAGGPISSGDIGLTGLTAAR